mgnify:CR=1 FL=1
MFSLACDPIQPRIQRRALATLACVGLLSQGATAAPADWFPDPPTIRHFAWTYQPRADSGALRPRPEWTRMAALAGVPTVRFLGAADEANGPAYSAAPDVVVLTPSALKLDACQLAFVVGHEIVHIARRHFDEDAVALSVFSGMPKNWTDQGEDALQLVDGDFPLALRVSHLWQDQEREADWMGALLAAQAGGCGIESGAIAYLRRESQAGGGLAAAHAPSEERIRHLLPFSESARRLSLIAPR